MEGVEIDPRIVKIHHPFSMVVCGPTSSGKSFWVYKFLKFRNQLIESEGKVVTNIFYCYSVEQQLYDTIKHEMKDILFYKGLPQVEEVYNHFDGKAGIIVLDDLMYEVLKNVDMLKLFTQGVHHQNVSVIFMSQNLFQQGVHARTIALNVKYLVLFYNPRDKSQVKYLGRQIYTGSGSGEILLEAYLDAVYSKRWGYLLVDLSMNCLEMLRLRTNILPQESDFIVVYRPRIAQ